MEIKKKKALFVINPISGGKSKDSVGKLIDRHIDNEHFDVELVFTEREHHATELTRQAIKNNKDYIIAVGGDGTINEVAQALIGTDKTLGVLPLGSGNGLARHLKIPLRADRAIKLINKQHTVRIDTCMVNNQPFLCTSGVGFDAYVSALFAQSGSRGFSTYVKSTLKAFYNFQPEDYYNKTDEHEMEMKAFSVTFANASQYGNDAYIAPQANIKDGLLDVCLLAPFPKWQMPSVGLGLFTKSLPKMPYYQSFRTKKVVLERKKAGASHLDGENFTFGERLEVAIKPKSLNILSA
ncbi:MAG: diacylglycerol/lipid kinase family protein [Thermonemataceae bacterium]